MPLNNVALCCAVKQPLGKMAIYAKNENRAHLRVIFLKKAPDIVEPDREAPGIRLLPENPMINASLTVITSIRRFSWYIS
jgi:hypothetical protein